MDVFTDRPYAGQPALGGARRRRPVHRADAGDRARAQPLRDGVPDGGDRTRRGLPAPDLHPDAGDALRRAPQRRGGVGAGPARPGAARAAGAGVRRGPASSWSSSRAGPRSQGGAPAVGERIPAGRLLEAVGLAEGDWTGRAARVCSTGIGFAYLLLDDEKAVAARGARRRAGPGAAPLRRRGGGVGGCSCGRRHRATPGCSPPGSGSARTRPPARPHWASGRTWWPAAWCRPTGSASTGSRRGRGGRPSVLSGEVTAQAGVAVATQHRWRGRLGGPRGARRPVNPFQQDGDRPRTTEVINTAAHRRRRTWSGAILRRLAIAWALLVALVLVVVRGPQRLHRHLRRQASTSSTPSTTPRSASRRPGTATSPR